MDRITACTQTLAHICACLSSVTLWDMHVHHVCLHTSSNKLELSGMLSIKTLFSAAGCSMTTLVVFRRFSSGSPSKLSLLKMRTQNNVADWVVPRNVNTDTKRYEESSSVLKMEVPFFIGVQISGSLFCHQLSHPFSLVLLAIAHARPEFWVYKLCCLHGKKHPFYYPPVKPNIATLFTL